MKRLYIATAAVLLSASLMASEDASWYKSVFGVDLSPQFSGTLVSPYEDWDSKARTHSVGATATAKVTLGCTGFDADFTFQLKNLASDIQILMDEPVMILVAASSYFVGSAYEVINQVSMNITETISGVTSSCENASKVLADFAVEKIPELAEHYCSGKNGGDDRQCTAENLNDSLNDLMRQWGQDIVDRAANNLISKVQPERERDKYYILGEQDSALCNNRIQNPEYLQVVYAATAMTCPELHMANNLLGNFVIDTQTEQDQPMSGGDQYINELVEYSHPKTNIERMFLDLSKAYGSALLEVVVTPGNAYKTTDGWKRLSYSPYFGVIDDLWLNAASVMHADQERERLANMIRIKADFAAQYHLQNEIANIEEYINEYNSMSGKAIVKLSNNPVEAKLASVKEQLETRIVGLREQRAEEAVLLNKVLLGQF